jgi:hypothetical protein
LKNGFGAEGHGNCLLSERRSRTLWINGLPARISSYPITNR